MLTETTSAYTLEQTQNQTENISVSDKIIFVYFSLNLVSRTKLIYESRCGHP